MYLERRCSQVLVLRSIQVIHIIHAEILCFKGTRLCYVLLINFIENNFISVILYIYNTVTLGSVHNNKIGLWSCGFVLPYYE